MSSIIGVIVGFALGQLASVLKWIYTSRRANKLCRLLVSLEIQHNLTLLQDYWHNVALPPDEDYEEEEGGENELRPKQKVEPEREVDRLARRAVEIPLPILSSRALDRQLAALPSALTESEMRSVWRFYEELAQIRSLHEWLSQLSHQGDTTKKSGFPSASKAVRSQALTSATFYDTKSAAIFDFRRAIADLLRAGNPLNPAPNQ